MSIRKKISSGFVLLYALLVASIVLVIGLTISNIVVKQLIISSIGREMNNAYYAANTGRECMSFIYGAKKMANENADLLVGTSINVNCSYGADVSGGPDVQLIGDWTDLFFLQNSPLTFTYKDNLSERTSCALIDLTTVDGVDGIQPVENNINFFFSRGYNGPCPQSDGSVQSGRTVERVLCQDFDLTTNNCKVEL